MMMTTGADVAIAAIIFGTLSGTAISAIKAFARRRTPDQGSLPNGGDLDVRLQRIEQAVDAIAIEVERMSESQRFTSKILADRLPTGQRALSDSSLDRG